MILELFNVPLPNKAGQRESGGEWRPGRWRLQLVLRPNPSPPWVLKQNCCSAPSLDTSWALREGVRPPAGCPLKGDVCGRIRTFRGVGIRSDCAALKNNNQRYSPTETNSSRMKQMSNKNHYLYSGCNCWYLNYWTQTT